MISRIVKYFCCEDISLIENYKNAVEDETQIWDCHHRREITENKTIKELKNENLYYHRPANELIKENIGISERSKKKTIE